MADYTGSGAPVNVGTTDANELRLISNDVARLILDASGNFGVGTSTDGNTKFYIFQSRDGSAPTQQLQSLLSLTNTTDGSAPQMALYVNNHAIHDTGTYALLRNYLMSELAGNGTITETYGARALTRVYDLNQPAGQTSSGVIESAYGLETYANNTSTAGKIRNATGIVISHAKATGSDAGHNHIARGLWIQPDVVASGGDTNTAWAIDSQPTAPSRFMGNVQLVGSVLQLLYSGNVNTVSLAAPAGMTAPVTYTLPAAPVAGEFLTTDASGNLAWSPAASGSAWVTATSGETLLGVTSASSLAGDPASIGAYKFDTVDSNRSFNVFDNYTAYYGNSSNSRQGTVFNLSVRPGDSSFSYSGEFDALAANAYASTPGTVGTLTGQRQAVATLNTAATVNSATGHVINVTAPYGIINNAAGLSIDTVQAKGSSTSGHTAVGLDIAATEITAAGSTSSNTAIGLRIHDNISAATDAYAIQSLSGQKSQFAGLLQADKGVQLTTSATQPTASAALRGTVWLVQGAAGVADSMQICLKTAADTYTWHTIVSG